MWKLNHKKGWAPKNWCFQIVVLKKTFESSTNWKEIKPVNPKGNQFWIFIGRTNAEAEAPILWPPDAKSWLIGKDPDTQKDWRQGEKGMTEDEMIGWHHWFNGHEFEQTLGVSERQGSLECCSPWGHKELDMTEQQNNNKKVFIYIFWNSPRISYFSSDSWYLSLENGLKNQDLGLPWYLNGSKKKKSACQCRRHGLNPWFRKIPHTLEQLSSCTTIIELCALESRSGNYWTPGALDPMLCNKRSHCNKKPTAAAHHS